MLAYRFKKCIYYIFFAALLLLSVFVTHNVLKAKESGYKCRDFFADKNDIDVMFFGTSHVENFFSPLDLWKEYGITAYNFGNPEEPIPVTYQLIRNAVYYKKPEIIVLDVSMFNSKDEYKYDSPMHYALDPFPLNKEKLYSINDIYDERDKKLDMLFTLSTYHSRWQDVGNDHKNDINYFMQGTLSYGHVYTMGIEEYSIQDYLGDIAEVPADNVDLKYINRITDFCSENGIELIFVSTPYILTAKEMSNVNYMEQFAKNHNIPFVNYNKTGSIIDTQIDLYNIGHVNQSGLHKVTTHFGSYLDKNYDLTDHRNIASYSEYYKKYDEYKALKYESLLSVDSLQSTLMLLHDKDISSFVYINNPQDILSDPQIYRLMQNINRENLTINSDMSLKSYELMPLSVLDQMLDQKYLLISNNKEYCEDGCFSELTGEEAHDTLSEFIKRSDILNDDSVDDFDALVIICDREANEVILSKAFNCEKGLMNGENIYDNAPKKYIYK